MDGMVVVSCGTENGFKVACLLLHKQREVCRATMYGKHGNWLSDDVM